MINRREFAKAVLAISGGALLGAPQAFSAQSDEALSSALEKIEKERGGRLGMAFVDTQTGKSASYRAEERFPMCSTFKLLAAAAVLSRVDGGQDRLDRRLHFDAADVVANSPVTKNKSGPEGMTLAEICQAAMTFSDNTAGNLMLATLGGPKGLTAYARFLGDTVTRLDRIEPELNEALPDDPRDTTSPAAMLSNIRMLTAGNILRPASREQLIAWLIGNKTGDARLRAGLPRDWRVGDKTGTGERGTANDVAAIWSSPDRAPMFITVYLTGDASDSKHQSATIASVASAIAALS